MAGFEPTDTAVPPRMGAIRLHAPGFAGLVFEEIETPRLCAGEALVQVHAAAITRDELDWPVDRLPAIDSVFSLSEARVAFERSLASGKRGKVVIRVVDD